MRPLTVQVIASICLIVAVISGCSSLMEKRNDPQVRREKIKQRLQADDRPMILSEILGTRQLGVSAISNIALVTHLAGTGGTVDPSRQREALIDSMRRNEIDDPNRILDSKESTMVTAKSLILPAAKSGDRYNVTVQLSRHSHATDLSQGWLRETPLMEITQFEGEGRVRTSFDYAKAEGALVTNAQYSGNTDPQAKLEAVVVGGARLLKGRELGLGVFPEYADAIAMGVIIPAINSRFTYFDGTKQKGVATPISDEYIELRTPENYRYDPYHFANVVLRISFNEPSEIRTQRVERLTAEIADSRKVRDACWQLEALGESSIEILASQLNNPHPEIQFYCAHSLAYLGDQRAIDVLADLAVKQSAFRAMSLTAIGSMKSYSAQDALKSLMHCSDPETRYGAVINIRKRNSTEPLIVAQQVPKVGGLLEIPSSGPELVAVSMHETAEVVFFGQVPTLTLPPFHNVSPNLLIQMTGPNEVTVTRFTPDQDEDASVRCAPDLRSVLLSIGRVGGGYGDWVSFVRECQSLGFMTTPVAMNPVPATGRTFDRESGTSIEDVDEELAPLEEDSSETKRGSNWYMPWTWWN